MNMNQHSDCWLPVETHMVIADAKGIAATKGIARLRIPAELHYSAADPWAVKLLFRTDKGIVPWQFARQLLCPDQGSESVEHGDVYVTLPDLGDRDVLIVSLNSPHGTADALLRVTDVNRFLQQTYQIVPIGDEHIHFDFDIEMERLMEPYGGDWG